MRTKGRKKDQPGSRKQNFWIPGKGKKIPDRDNLRPLRSEEEEKITGETKRFQLFTKGRGGQDLLSVLSNHRKRGQRHTSQNHVNWLGRLEMGGR